VPGHRPELADKAFSGEADAVVLDLEDAVPPAEKAHARAAVAALLARDPGKPAWVRVNAVATGLAEADVEAVAGPALAGIRIPKAESPEEVRVLGDRLRRAGASAAIHCLIESARGLERAAELARADPAVTGIALGEADLRADLGVASEEGLLYARSRCVVAARAAGLDPPVQSVYPDVRDLEGLRRTSAAGRALGFFGRSAIHPAQVPVIHAAFTPTPDEVAAARELVDRLQEVEDAGAGALALPDGRFVDRAVAEGARRVLALARRLEGSLP